MFSLVKLLGTPRLNFQLQYQLIFCVWLLAFNVQTATALNKSVMEHCCLCDIVTVVNRYGIIVLLADILRQSIKIKVHRITVAALRVRQL